MSISEALNSDLKLSAQSNFPDVLENTGILVVCADQVSVDVDSRMKSTATSEKIWGAW